jgi:exosortase
MKITRIPPTCWFTAYTACMLAAHISMLHSLGDLASVNPTASHVVGIPPVSIALVYLNRKSVFASVKTSVLPGLGLVLIGMVLAAVSHLADVQNALAIAVTGFVVLWVGGFVLFYGTTAARAALFPLMFLAFMIPLPDVVINGATSLLKRGSANLVGAFFTMIGTPYHRQGFVFNLPGLAIEIADECSGIRSSIALALTALLASHRFLAQSWTRTVLVVAILPIAIIKNAVRIVSLSLLAIHVDASFLTGQLHHEGGIAFFLLALGMLLLLYLMLRRYEAPTPPLRGVTA